MSSGKDQKKVIQVPLDTTDVINLNHLDVIPMQFLSSLNSSASFSINRKGTEELGGRARAESQSQAHVNKDKMPAHVTPRRAAAVTIRSDRKGVERKPGTTHKSFKRRTRTLPALREKPDDSTFSSTKVTLSPSFDRHGRMTRITADYNQDSENSEYYRQVRLRRKKHLKHSENQKSVLRNYLNNIEYSPIASGISSEDDFGVQNLNNTEPVQCTTESISKCLNFLETFNFQDEPTSSSELDKLAEALEQLQKSCNSDFLLDTDDSSRLHPAHGKTEDILTLCPTNPIAFKCDSSVTVLPSETTGHPYETNINRLNQRRNSAAAKQHPLPHYCYGRNGERFQNDSQEIFSSQKAANMWEWVSPAYIREIEAGIGSSFLTTQQQDPDSPRNQTRQDSFSYGDNQLTLLCENPHGKPNLTDKTLLDLRTIQSAADELPLTPRTIFAPITATIEDMLMNSSNPQQVTPPATSSWSVSPIYEAESKSDNEPLINPRELTKDTEEPQKFSECKGIGCELAYKAFSDSSLAPAVHSMVSLADVQSGEDIPTRCSSNSTFSDFSDHNPSESLSDMNDQRIQNLLMQLTKTGAQRKTLSFSKYISSLVQNKTESGYDPEHQSASSNPATPEIHYEAIHATMYSQSKSDYDLVDQNAPKFHVSENNTRKLSQVSLTVQTAVSDGKNRKCQSDSKISNHSLSRKSRRKKEKKKESGKNRKREKEHKEDVDVEIKGKGQQHKDSVTQTLAEQPIQRLKNALPRTPGGRYSLEGKAAEEAIAAYVRAELAASLECAQAIRNRNGKTKIHPVYGNLGEFLRKVAYDSKVKHRLSKGHLSTSKVSVKSIGAKTRIVPKLLSKPARPLNHERPKNIILPRQSNRINFIRYQQQSMAAMRHYSKSRNSKKADLGTELNDPMKMSSPNSKEYVDRLRTRKDAFNNRFKSNRNTVTVVFDQSLE